MTNQEAYEILTSDYYIAFDSNWMGNDRCEKADEAIKKAAKALQIVMDLADMMDECGYISEDDEDEEEE